jgi:hypothetical protein
MYKVTGIATATEENRYKNKVHKSIKRIAVVLLSHESEQVYHHRRFYRNGAIFKMGVTQRLADHQGQKEKITVPCCRLQAGILPKIKLP